MRKFLALIVTPLILAGCGGSGTTSGTTPPPPPPPPAMQVIAPPGPPNVEKLVVDSGPGALTTPAVNTAFISVTVCMPGTSTCQTIDHIEVDTGSVGLRILADAVTSAGAFNLALPAVKDPSNPSNVLAECLQFADGFSWGSVNTADIKLPVSMESATGVVVHVIGATSAGDPSKANPTCVPLPGSPLAAGLCVGVENTVPCFGANGILGVGPFINDCQSTAPCAPLTPICNGASPCIPGNSATYFTCTAAPACTQVASQVTPQLQVQNPAALFATDNNGVISATLNSTTYPFSYLDSGSNANFFPTTSIPSCPSPNDGFLCPTAGTTVNESATLTGTNSMTLAADFSIVNANTLFGGSNTAFSNLAGSSFSASGPNNSLDLGLSFFYGHNVFTGFEDVQTMGAPYFAY